MSGETLSAAHGRWRDILPQLGVDPKFLVNKHGPCPICGGRDRFRFDDKGGHGGYYCNQCSPGNGINLLRKLHNWSYGDACRKVDAIIGTSAPRIRTKTSTGTDARETRLAKIQRVISEAADPSIVNEHLTGRGLTVFPTILRGHPALSYYEDRKFQRLCPAMVAPVIGPDGTLQTVWRTYLADVTARKKAMTPVDTINGAAVRLFEPGDVLGVAEGVETAIAAHELFNIPTWSALTARGVETFEPPEIVRKLTIFGDNDRNYRGQKAAYVLANRLAVDKHREISVEVLLPPTPGQDWLDVLNSRRD